MRQRQLSQISRHLLLDLIPCLLASCAIGASPVATATTNPSFPPLVCAQRSDNPVTLTMYYGSEKQEWINDVIPDFNRQHISACDGPITVNAIAIGSGDSEQGILDGTIKPDVWSPAGSVWLSLLNASWPTHDIVGSGANDNRRLVVSPVVVAMWKPEAEALGWPGKPIGWSDIAALSTNPQGWAAYGHPEFGAFKFGHTHPEESNSGLDAIIAENYAAVGKQRGLSLNDVTNPTTKAFVANAENAIIHYGDSTGFFATEMFDKGPNYLSAAVMYESLVVESYDTKAYPQSKQYPPVVAIYPKEGTFLSDHPFVVPNAPWMTASKKAAAQRLGDYLLDGPQQQKALHYGFRPAQSGTNGLSAPLDDAHGVDPAQPQTILPIPDVAIINAIKQAWNEQRRKVDVMLVLDRSGSMNGVDDKGVTKIAAARTGMVDFVNQLGSGDGIGITVFSTDAQVLMPITPIGDQKPNIIAKINAITAEGNTRLYDTVAEQFASVNAFSSTNIKAVVVLTDGIDNASTHTVDALVSQIRPNGDDAGKGVKIFTIAYGDDADSAVLNQIADASGGVEFDGNTTNIREVYLAISRFF